MESGGEISERKPGIDKIADVNIRGAPVDDRAEGYRVGRRLVPKQVRFFARARTRTESAKLWVLIPPVRLNDMAASRIAPFFSMPELLPAVSM